MTDDLQPTTVAGTPAEADEQTALDTATRVRTVPAHDEIERDGEALVLVDGRAQLVSVLGALVRSRAVEGASVAELAEHLEAELGSPPEGSALDLTTEAVATLLDAGLLEREV